MTVAQPFFMNYPPSSYLAIRTEEMAQLGVQAIFQARPIATTHTMLTQMERRDRIVLILLDGKRTIQDVARLIHRNELEVAKILVRLLKCGYVEYIGG